MEKGSACGLIFLFHQIDLVWFYGIATMVSY